MQVSGLGWKNKIGKNGDEEDGDWEKRYEKD